MTTPTPSMTSSINMNRFGEWKETKSTYLSNIQTHCYPHPSLKLLQELPPAPEFTTHIKVLEFTSNGISDIDINKLPQLDAYWTSSTRTACKGRLYIVEDISLPWISALGSRFDIDPRFFAEYLRFDPDRTQNFLEGYHTMRRLASLRDKSDISTFVYHEIRTFGSNAPRREQYEILTRNNVTRLVTTVDHHSDKSTGLIRRNLSVWYGKRKNEEEPWDVIILCDAEMNSRVHLRRWTGSRWTHATCTNGPYLDGFLDFASWPPTYDCDINCFCPSSTSMLDAIAHYWHNASSYDLKIALGDPKHAPLFAFRIICSNWNLQLEYLVSVVSDLEKGLLRFEQMDAHPRAETITAEVGALRTLLSDVNSWRRRVYFYLEQIKWNAEALGLPTETAINGIVGVEADVGVPLVHDTSSTTITATSSDTRPFKSQSNAAAQTAIDYLTILTSLRLTQQRIQSLLPVVMGAFSLLEAQHSVIKADLTIRLSSVALLFVPLSYTASLLSMSDDFLPGKRLFWVYFVVSAPIILTLFWWAYWVQLGRLKRGGGRLWKRKLGRGKEE